MSLQPFARIMILIAVVVIMLRAFIPMGYMPELGSGKVFAMTICSLDGPKTIMVDEKYHPVSEQKSHHSTSSQCEFSIVQHAFLGNDFATVEFGSAKFDTVQDNVLQTSAFIPALFRGAHSAQGPPAFFG